MKILIVEPGREPRTKEINGTLREMQDVVGGLIQAVYPFDELVALVCNDEGKLLGLPLNRALRLPETGEVYDVIAGTFFLCGAPPDSNRFASLTDEQLSRYAQRFRVPEFFAEEADEV